MNAKRYKKVEAQTPETQEVTKETKSKPVDQTELIISTLCAVLVLLLISQFMAADYSCEALNWLYLKIRSYCHTA